MSGAKPDPTGGTTHYYASTMPKAPVWTVGAKRTFKRIHHVFLKDCAMAAFHGVSCVLVKSEEDWLFFECPGCDMIHGILHGSGPEPRWNWNSNGDVETRTFAPSVLVRYC